MNRQNYCKVRRTSGVGCEINIEERVNLFSEPLFWTFIVLSFVLFMSSKYICNFLLVSKYIRINMAKFNETCDYLYIYYAPTLDVSVTAHQ